MQQLPNFEILSLTKKEAMKMLGYTNVGAFDQFCKTFKLDAHVRVTEDGGTGRKTIYSVSEINAAWQRFLSDERFRIPVNPEV